MNDSPPPFDFPLSARLFWRSLLLIALLGLCLRMLPLSESFWLDELHSAWTIAGDWNDVAGRVLQGNNSPLYFWGLKGIAAIFGDSEWTLRMPSVFCGCATLIGVAILVRHWSGSGLAGCVAALLIALDRDMIFYATEVRPYAAVQLGCLALFATTIRLWGDFTMRDAAIWALLAAVTIHLHITAGLFVAACLPPAILAAWGHAAAKRLLLMFAGLALALLPLIPQLALVYGRRENWGAFIQSGSPFEIIEILPIIPFGLLPWAIGWGLNRLFPNREAGAHRSAATPVFAMSIFATMAPIVVVWLLTYLQITPLFLRRYLMGSQAMLFVWCGLNVARIDQVCPRAVIAAALAISICCFHLPEHWTLQRRQDWRGAVAAVNQMQLPPETTLLIASRLIEADDLTQNKGQLADYCRLPIGAIYPANQRFQQVIPLAFSNPGVLQRWQLDLLEKPQTILVVTPGDHATAEILAVQLSQSIPWPSSVRILPERRGMQMLLITDANSE
ncbi:glycosyltransferase family 39 protein [Blastopirellula sp. J2-11]|uniref:glycosyltransferase family 39 protein n=1 Tax=Blastopirellula sp. J2-11 TaxID=2943192 RepID=UPI0021C63C26|nr:glycosyltransferase family 39 protein [Blastopirellula sp. J2-11]UUO08503.1 glycosyltransferase family 39 protein [Blastopirellula sp. J2-11]